MTMLDVPRRADPELPPDVAEAVRLLGNVVRVAVLRSLATDGRGTRADLLRRIGNVSEANLHAHIDLLESAGVIVADPSRERDPGPVTRHYSLRDGRVVELVDALKGAILPPR